METIKDRLNEKFKFDFKLGWKKSVKLNADWDGDCIWVGNNEYVIYHTVVQDVGILDWIKLLIYKLGGKTLVYHYPMVG